MMDLTSSLHKAEKFQGHVLYLNTVEKHYQCTDALGNTYFAQSPRELKEILKARNAQPRKSYKPRRAATVWNTPLFSWAR